MNTSSVPGNIATRFGMELTGKDLADLTKRSRIQLKARFVGRHRNTLPNL